MSSIGSGIIKGVGKTEWGRILQSITMSGIFLHFAPTHQQNTNESELRSIVKTHSLLEKLLRKTV